MPKRKKNVGGTVKMRPAGPDEDGKNWGGGYRRRTKHSSKRYVGGTPEEKGDGGSNLADGWRGRALSLRTERGIKKKYMFW